MSKVLHSLAGHEWVIVCAGIVYTRTTHSAFRWGKVPRLGYQLMHSGQKRPAFNLPVLLFYNSFPLLLQATPYLTCALWDPTITL